MTVASDFALLARDPATGSLLCGTDAYGPTLAGALLADLLIERRVGRDARDRIVVLDKRPVGDPAVDRTLGLVVADPRPHPVVRWLALFDTEVMRDTVRDDLIARGVLVERERMVLGVFRRRSVVEGDAAVGTRAVAAMQAVLAGEVDGDERTRALVGFCDAAGILRRLVTPIDPERLKVHREADVAQAVRRIIAARREPAVGRNDVDYAPYAFGVGVGDSGGGHHPGGHGGGFDFGGGHGGGGGFDGGGSGGDGGGGGGGGD